MKKEIPEFFRKGFQPEGGRKLFCETGCKAITLHDIKVIQDSPVDNGVPTFVACLACYNAWEALDKIGIEKDPPIRFQRFFTNAYVYLILHPDYI